MIYLYFSATNQTGTKSEMTYFKDVSTQEDLKRTYRKLAFLNHPDRGGNMLVMQGINNEYCEISREFGRIPENLHHVRKGNIVFVNNTRSVVTEVDKTRFKARSCETNRELYFSKSSGYAMLNFRFRATVFPN